MGQPGAGDPGTDGKPTAASAPTAAQRDQAADHAAIRTADERDWTADERDRTADARETHADEREKRLDARKELVTKRAEQLQLGDPDRLASSLEAIALGRDAVHRSMARLERTEAALNESRPRADWEQAEIDREVAASRRALDDHYYLHRGD